MSDQDMTEPEARAIMYAIGTAFIDNDKQAREMVYADLTNEELKKVLRWSVRMNLNQFFILSQLQGFNFKEGWKVMALDNAMDQQGGDD